MTTKRSLDDYIKDVVNNRDTFSYTPEILDAVILFYRNKSMSDDTIDLLINFEILRMIAWGASNNWIAEIYSMEQDDVKDIAQRFFKFPGWSHDLEFSPLFLNETLDFGEEPYATAKRISDAFIVYKQILDTVLE